MYLRYCAHFFWLIGCGLQLQCRQTFGFRVICMQCRKLVTIFERCHIIDSINCGLMPICVLHVTWQKPKQSNASSALCCATYLLNPNLIHRALNNLMHFSVDVKQPQNSIAFAQNHRMVLYVLCYNPVYVKFVWPRFFSTCRGTLNRLVLCGSACYYMLQWMGIKLNTGNLYEQYFAVVRFESTH